MTELFSTLLTLLLIAIAFAFMFGGPTGPGKLLGCLFAPFAGCVKSLGQAVVGLLVLLFVGYIGWQYLLDRLGVPGQGTRPQPTAKPPVAKTAETPKPKPTPVPTETPTPQTGAARHFDYPVGALDASGRRRGAGWYVSQDFADVKNAYSKQLSGQHLGEDWVKSTRPFDGEPVYAIADGAVIRSEANRSYGHVVMIRHTLPEGAEYSHIVSLYGHLGSKDVIAPSAEVRRGDTIGRIGQKGDNGVSRDGTPWAVHLHFELRGPTTAHADDFVHYGYSGQRPAFLNPTDATSKGNPSGDGWIDAHW